MILLRALLASVLIFSCLSSPSHADEVFTFVVKKQEEKKKNRWSLSEWIDTRDRMRMMDLWLALHSPSPYEFFVSGAYLNGDSGSERYKGAQFSAAAYASIFGLEGQVERFLEKTQLHGTFNLRVFGFHVQATNITLQAGVRSQSSPEGSAIRNGFAGVNTTVYLAKYFGLQGLYRHYFDSAGSVTQALKGQRYEGSAFIDFRFLRVFGTYFSEPSTLNSDGLVIRQTQKGFLLGTRFFF